MNYVFTQAQWLFQTKTDHTRLLYFLMRYALQAESFEDAVLFLRILVKSGPTIFKQTNKSSVDGLRLKPNLRWDHSQTMSIFFSTFTRNKILTEGSQQDKILSTQFVNHPKFNVSFFDIALGGSSHSLTMRELSFSQC